MPKANTCGSNIDHTGPLHGIPYLGSGLGYRGEIRDAILAAPDRIDFLEVVADQFLGSAWALDELRQLCERFTVIPHGIALSIGSAAGVDPSYLEGIKRVSDITRAPYYSEHLCVTGAPGLEIGHLSPIWFTDEILDRTIRNVRVTQDVLEKPLVLENITYSFEIGRAQMSQSEFFGRLVDVTGCGILLDVTNLFINSTNHGFDPLGFLDDMPLDRVVQVHIAGGYWAEGVLIDSHSETVNDQAWWLLEALVARTPVRGVILERDANFPNDIAPLLDELSHARSILDVGVSTPHPA